MNLGLGYDPIKSAVVSGKTKWSKSWKSSVGNCILLPKFRNSCFDRLHACIVSKNKISQYFLPISKVTFLKGRFFTGTHFSVKSLPQNFPFKMISKTCENAYDNHSQKFSHMLGMITSICKVFWCFVEKKITQKQHFPCIFFKC